LSIQKAQQPEKSKLPFLAHLPNLVVFSLPALVKRVVAIAETFPKYLATFVQLS
jgi:hypothetical protein